MGAAPTRLEFGFEGRVALVSGAAGDIGWAIARAFHAAVATVVATDRDKDGLHERMADLDEAARCVPVVLDLTNEAALQAGLEPILERLGRVDILVNNAAHEPARGTLDAIGRDRWDATLAVNLGGAFLLVRHVLPYMRRQRSGVVINIASQLGHVSAPGSGAYSASKAALIALTRSIALDHAHEGIRAVSVSPGAVMTGRLRRLFGSDEKAIEALAPKHPLGRLGTPEEIAAAVLFLASDQAGFITGTGLIVDGGYIAQ